jgi:hypothetical protein
VIGVSISDLMRGLSVDPKTGQAVRAGGDLYAPFLLNWPLGMGPGGAGDAAQLWLDQPLEYLATLKESAQGVISKLMLTRRVGLPRAERPPAGDMPFLFDGQPAFYPGDAEKGNPGSVLHQPQRSRFDQGLDAMIREIDMAIEKLDAKIGRKK